MAKATKYVVGVLTLIVAIVTVTIMFNNQLKIQVDKTKSTFYVNENDKWNIAGVETLKIYDGAKPIKFLDATIKKDITENLVTISRESQFANKIVVKDIYKFDGRIDDVKLFPISHSVEILGGKGLTFQYEVSKLNYTGVKRDVAGHEMAFGKNMRVEWQEGSYSAKITEKGILTIKYKIPENEQIYNVRLFDPTNCDDVIANITSNKTANIEMSCNFGLTQTYLLNASTPTTGALTFTASGTADNPIIIDCGNGGIKGNSTGYGFYASGKSNIIIKNCYVEYYLRGMMLSNENISVFNNTFNLSDSVDVWFTDARYMKLINNTAYDTRQSSFYYNAVNYSLATDNKINRHGWAGYDILGSFYNNFTNTVIDGNGIAGIALEGLNGKLGAYNIIENLNISNTRAGRDGYNNGFCLEVIGNVSNSILRNIRCINITGPSDSFGIWINDQYSDYPKYNRFENIYMANIVGGTASTGIGIADGWLNNFTNITIINSTGTYAAGIRLQYANTYGVGNNTFDSINILSYLPTKLYSGVIPTDYWTTPYYNNRFKNLYIFNVSVGIGDPGTTSLKHNVNVYNSVINYSDVGVRIYSSPRWYYDGLRTYNTITPFWVETFGDGGNGIINNSNFDDPSNTYGINISTAGGTDINVYVYNTTYHYEKVAASRELWRYNYVYGQVLDSSNNPVPNANITIKNGTLSDFYVGSTKSDSQGFYTYLIYAYMRSGTTFNWYTNHTINFTYYSSNILNYTNMSDRSYEIDYNLPCLSNYSSNIILNQSSVFCGGNYNVSVNYSGGIRANASLNVYLRNLSRNGPSIVINGTTKLAQNVDILNVAMNPADIFTVIDKQEAIAFNSNITANNAIFMLDFGLNYTVGYPNYDASYCGLFNNISIGPISKWKTTKAMNYLYEKSGVGQTELSRIGVVTSPRRTYNNSYRIYFTVDEPVLTNTTYIIGLNLNTTFQSMGINSTWMNDTTARVYRISRNGGIYNDSNFCFEQAVKLIR